MDTGLHTAAQGNPNFWYPALTDEEVANPITLASNYRAALARERRLYLVGGILAGIWLIGYVRQGPRKRRRSR